MSNILTFQRRQEPEQHTEETFKIIITRFYINEELAETFAFYYVILLVIYQSGSFILWVVYVFFWIYIKLKVAVYIAPECVYNINGAFYVYFICIV